MFARSRLQAARRNEPCGVGGIPDVADVHQEPVSIQQQGLGTKPPSLRGTFPLQRVSSDLLRDSCTCRRRVCWPELVCARCSSDICVDNRPRFLTMVTCVLSSPDHSAWGLLSYVRLSSTSVDFLQLTLLVLLLEAQPQPMTLHEVGGGTDVAPGSDLCGDASLSLSHGRRAVFMFSRHHTAFLPQTLHLWHFLPPGNSRPPTADVDPPGPAQSVALSRRTPLPGCGHLLPTSSSSMGTAAGMSPMFLKPKGLGRVMARGSMEKPPHSKLELPVVFGIRAEESELGGWACAPRSGPSEGDPLGKKQHC